MGLCKYQGDNLAQAVYRDLLHKLHSAAMLFFMHTMLCDQGLIVSALQKQVSTSVLAVGAMSPKKQYFC